MTMFRQLLEERQSIREYEPRPVEKEKLQYIVECAQKAPTSRNSQSCFYHVLTDRKVIEKISQEGCKFAETQGYSMKQVAKNIGQELDEQDPFFYRAPVLIIMTQPQEDIQSGGIQTMALLLAAQEVGLRSCCIGLGQFAWDEIKKHITVPDKHVFGLAYTIGYSNSKPPVRVKDLTKVKYY